MLALALFSLSDTVKKEWRSDIEIITKNLNLFRFSSSSSFSASNQQKSSDQGTDHKSGNNAQDEENPKRNLNLSSNSSSKIDNKISEIEILE